MQTSRATTRGMIPGPAWAWAILVPDGTRLFATLDTPLSMRNSRNGEPFTMTVHSPAEYQGARIDGVITRVNAYRNSGNVMDMRVDFRTIELRGRSMRLTPISTGCVWRTEPS